jgi:hypothetical protein
MSTGLSLIYQELQKLQLNIPIAIPDQLETPRPQSEPRQRTQSRASSQNLQSRPSASQESHRLPTSNSIATSTAGAVAPGISGPPITTTSPSSMYHSCPLPQQTGAFDMSQQAYPSLDQLGYNVSPNRELNYMSGVSLSQSGTGISYEITPEVYEAFSYIQPITTNMTSGYDSGW